MILGGDKMKYQEKQERKTNNAKMRYYKLSTGFHPEFARVNSLKELRKRINDLVHTQLYKNGDELSIKIIYNEEAIK